MSFRKTHDIAVKVGTYEKNGETKSRYENVGYVLTDETGRTMHFLNRTFNPAGVPLREGESEGSVLLSIFEKKSDNAQQGGYQSSQPAYQSRPQSQGEHVDDFKDDDIPSF